MKWNLIFWMILLKFCGIVHWMFQLNDGHSCLYLQCCRIISPVWKLATLIENFPGILPSFSWIWDNTSSMATTVSLHILFWFLKKCVQQGHWCRALGSAGVELLYLSQYNDHTMGFTTRLTFWQNYGVLPVWDLMPNYGEAVMAWCEKLSDHLPGMVERSHRSE